MAVVPKIPPRILTTLFKAMGRPGSIKEFHRRLRDLYARRGEVASVARDERKLRNALRDLVQKVRRERAAGKNLNSSTPLELIRRGAMDDQSPEIQALMRKYLAIKGPKTEGGQLGTSASRATYKRLMAREGVPQNIIRILAQMTRDRP